MCMHEFAHTCATLVPRVVRVFVVRLLPRERGERREQRTELRQIACGFVASEQRVRGTVVHVALFQQAQHAAHGDLFVFEQVEQHGVHLFGARVGVIVGLVIVVFAVRPTCATAIAQQRVFGNP